MKGLLMRDLFHVGASQYQKRVFWKTFRIDSG